MTKLNIAILLAALFHGLIVLPLGHGGVPIIALEIISVADVISGEVTFSGGGGDYERSLPVSILLSLIGHIFLFAALFIKNDLKKVYFTWIGTIALTVSIINILFHADFIWGFVFLFSLPFFVIEVWLIFLTVRRYKTLKYSASSSMWD